MVWHSGNRNTDGLVWHVGDSKAWVHIDAMWSEFVEKPCNVRLGPTTDGVNPFGERIHLIGLTFNSSWSTLQQQGAILRSTYHRKQQRKKFLKARLCEP